MKSSDVLSKWSLRARETSYKEAVRRFLVIKGYVGLKTMMSHILEFFCQSKYATNCKEKLSLSKKMEPLHSFDLLEFYVWIRGKILWLTINSSLIALINMHGPTADSN